MNLSNLSTDSPVYQEQVITLLRRQRDESLKRGIDFQGLVSPEVFKRAFYPPLSLAAFVEKSSQIRLDPWQLHLCDLLESVTFSRGRRVLIHAPPQHGKSLIVSQRFPAWYLAVHASHVVKLAAYNITHASGFTRSLRDLMTSEEFCKWFPDPALRLTGKLTESEFSTHQRAQKLDAQPSVKALGLESGFTGQGAHLLIIDDPFASATDAQSPVMRERTWYFWEGTALPRLSKDSNVIAMFHRYHAQDLAGRLLDANGWEYYRYSAIADGNYVHPGTGLTYPDPMGRASGEHLSPRFSPGNITYKSQTPAIWLSQFIGRPTPKQGAMFLADNLTSIAPRDLPERFVTICRAWDLAATQDGGDYTAGVKIALDVHGRYYILDVVRFQKETNARNQIMLDTARRDGVSCKIHLPQDPGQAGKDQAAYLVRMFAGFQVRSEPVSGHKETRAEPFASQVNAGQVFMLENAWNMPFREELRAFPLGGYDDQVDAASDAFTELSQPVFRETRLLR